MIDALPHPPTLPGISWRAARKSDIEGIVALQDAVFEVDGGFREVASEILDRWASDYCVAGHDSLLGVNDEGEVIASVWSYVPSIADTKWRAFQSDNYVHPAYRTPEVCDFVLDWWEARSMQRFGTKDDDLPRWFWREAYDWQKEKIEFLESHGYEPGRYYDEVAADLSNPLPVISLPDGLTCRTWESAPLEDSRVVHNEAFADHWGSQPRSAKSWTELVTDFHLARASFVVYDAGAPVSYLLSSAFPHDFEDKGRREAWIEGLGTIRSHRKRGIASALVVLAMDRFKRLRMEYAVLGVDTENSTGAYGLYEALGFVHDRRGIAYVKEVTKDSASA